MENLPLVTVAIPSFNHSQYVISAINSVIDQAYQDIELIIIDDGSSDNSVELISGIVERCTQRFKRFKFISRDNQGVTFTLKQALEWGEGDFFTVLASDDEFLPGKIEKQIIYFRNNEQVDACCGGVVETSLDRTKVIRKLPKDRIYSFEDIVLFNYFLPAPTLMLRMSRFNKQELFPGRYKLEDFYLYMFMTFRGMSISCLSDVLSMYRRHEANSSKVSFRLHAKERLEIIDLYTESKFHKKGYSYSVLIEATQLLGFSRREGIVTFLEAIKKCPSVLLSLRCLRFVVLSLLPKKYVLKTLRL